MLLISLIAGFVAGFIALIFSFPFSVFGTAVWVLVLLVVIEELVKSGMLFFLFRSSSWLSRWSTFLSNAVFFGFGFGFFEIGLISLGLHQFYLSSLIMVVIHVVCSVMIALAIIQWEQKKKPVMFGCLILLSIFFHLCYNLIVKFF